MYKTKKEVDIHVRTSLSKLRSDNERNLRSFTIAKLYFKINEYTTAEQYLNSYLLAKEDNEQAHKLLGHCYQHLKKPDKALQAFQRSLQLNPKQPEILIEVCKLMLEDNNLNNNKAQYWCELAESENVQDDAVFSLRLKLMKKGTLETNQVEALIQKEIASRPNDVQLRVRLIRNYIEQNQILDAFKYVHQLEMQQKDEFVRSSEWYNVVWLVLNKYEQMPNTKKDWDFWLLLSICLERQVQISFSLTTNSSVMGGGATESANLLFKLDQYLFKISQLSDKLCVQKELVDLFLDHYSGQMLIHASALIFKRELLQNKNKWKETVRAALPLLLLAFQVNVPDNRESWMKHCDEQGKQLIALWLREGSFRCAQAGRTLLSCINDVSNADKENTRIINKMIGSQLSELWNSGDELLEQIRQTCADRQWRRNIFALLFCNSDQKVKEQSSFFVKNIKHNELRYELPSYADVERFEESAQYLKPQSLKHMVYLCIANENLAYVKAKYFSGLNFSTQNLSFCGAESLNQLDIDSFLYATTIQAKRCLEIEREAFDNYQSGNSSAAGKPKILPFVNLQNHLCTEEQAQWWHAAYMVYKNLSSSNDLAELRANLQYGIEAVRGINGPKLDMSIVFKLGQIFVARAQDIVKPIEKSFLEARAESIYKYGLNMMKMHNKGVLEPFRKYFKYTKSQTSAVERELASAAEDAVSYLATRYFKKAEYEDLIEELSGIQLPFATYLQAEAYRKLDEASKTPKKAKRLYLDRASECLQQTLALLKSSSHADPNHPLNSVIHNEIKRLHQASARYVNDSTNFSPLTGHNNSSTYEDAEADFYSDNSILPTSSRSRRDTLNANAVAALSNHNQEMENLVKQMASTLSLLKDEIMGVLKPELQTVTKEISTLKDKITNLEETMKRTRISSNPPSRDDASNVLDDLYIIEESLQQQQPYQQQQSTPHLNHQQYGSNSAGGSAALIANSPFMAQHHMQAAAAAYNNPMYPSSNNYPLNFYGHGQPPNPYMMAPQAGHGQAMNPRLPNLPFLDPTQPMPAGLNYNISTTPSTPLLPQPTVPTHHGTASETSKNSNLYTLLQQPPQPISHQNATNFSTPLSNISTPQPSLINNISTPATMAPPSTALQFNKVINKQPVDKGPPANVVITSSDPLPNPNSITMQTQQQAPLSVTIPSHHIKPSLISQPQPSVLLPQSEKDGISLMSKLATTTPITSATTFGTPFGSTTFSFKPQIAAAAAAATNNSIVTPSNDTLNKTTESVGSDFNRSGTEDVEYDPRPDFKPIIPLPDEIEVRTGEEEETVMFCHRAKLFRHQDKEWKERGIGDIKILKNKDGSSRILMRRDQTHKICANHKITNEMALITPKDDTKNRFIWAANDFADEELHLEKFLVRFKLPETAAQFEQAFKQATKEAEIIKKKDSEKPEEKSTTAPFSLGKSTFTTFATSTPAQKNVEASIAPAAHVHTTSAGPIASTTSITAASKSLFAATNIVAKTPVSVQPTASTSAASPFANFTFGKPVAAAASNTQTLTSTTTTMTSSPFASIFSNLNKSVTSPFSNLTPNDDANASSATTINKSTTSDNEDEYVPTAQFKPVIPLPDLVEVNTGEENELLLFEHRAKLLRFDRDAGEWKERGIGNIKLLQDKDDLNKVRLVMRREQIHKLCCNQRIYKDTIFKYAKNSKTALSWAGQDYSENQLVTEMLTVRFKTPETCKEFLETIQLAQSKMGTDANEENSKISAVVKVQADTTSAKGFGDAFKPKTGSWSCNACYISNNADKLYCVACDTPKDDTVPKKETTSNILATSGKTNFSFGFAAAGEVGAAAQSEASKTSFTFGSGSQPLNQPAANKSTTPAIAPPASSVGFGDKFKPKSGSWACEACYLSNPGDEIYCKACDAPKDSTIPKKDANTNILALSNPAQKFSFGFGTAAGVTETSNNSAGFSFDKAATKTDTDGSKTFSFTPPTATSTTLGSENADATNELPGATLGKPPFSFSLNSKAMETSARPAPIIITSVENQAFSLDKKEFNFILKPKSPGKGGKSPMKFGGGDADVGDVDDGDADYHEEEENNTYFTPVIPLPDKINVKTGEEDEDLLYVHRAKLFRFIESEWKERGLGNVKILRHKQSQKLRVVMRREQILKICLNHVLNEDVDYKRKDEKSWLFVVNDFSEGAVELEKFSLRFKTKEVAESFMNVVQKALDGTAQAIESPCNSSLPIQTTPQTPTAIETLSEDVKQLAEKLKLPYDFFASKPACAGCRGCNPEDFVYDTNMNAENFVNQEDMNPLEPLEQPALALSKTNNSILNKSFLKQSVLSPAASSSTTKTINTTDTTKIQDGIFSEFIGANSTTVASSANEKPANTTFSFTAALNSTAKPAFGEIKPASGGFLFGSGPTPVFGGNSKETKPTIFGGTASSAVFASNESSSSAEKTTTGKSIFGGIGGGGTNSGSIFGGKPTFGSGTSIFANSNSTFIENESNAKSIFGSSSKNLTGFGNIASVSQHPASETSIFGSNSSSGGSLFGLVAKDSNPTTSTSSPAMATTFTDLGKTSVASLDFASVIANASANSPKITEKSGPGGFVGLTNQNAFSNFGKPLKELDTSNKDISKIINESQRSSLGGDANENDENDENYDPHYEPIIELPNEIIVSTGEEDETKLFGERATLYRWDDINKEWKERGVGELKILLHTSKQTYRMVMRREQIHKLVLNQAVGSDLIFNNMSNNPKSFVWAGLNYAETTEGELEKLAVRFKKVELAEQFSKQLKKCIEHSKQREGN